MATDIAFALGLLVILGRGAPLALKVLLAAVAVVDDLGAILVIAFAYTPEVGWGALGWGAVFLAGLAGLGHLRVQRPWPYVVLGAALWYALLRSGVHATLAGVLVAFTIPLSTRDADDEPLLHRMEHALHPWVAFLIVPAFALANAGVAVGVDSVALLLQPVGLGIVLGLVVGKPLGILSFSWLAVRARVAELPPGVTWGTMAGIASLAGIGFTMALFIGNLAFVDPTVLEQAKIAILFASVVSAGLARVFFQAARKAAAAPDATAGAAPATPGPVPEEEMDEAA